MAYINASARNYQIEIQIPGGSSLDVSQACSGESNGYLVLNESEPDESGIITVTGKLTLQVSDKYLDGNSFTTWSDNGQTGRDVFDPDLNPTRWAPGNYVRIQVANDSGSLVAFSRDYLRILRIPSSPYAGNWILELEIGDDLTLLSWRSPDDDASGVTRGTLFSVGNIVQSVLTRAGFNDAAGINSSTDDLTLSGTINYNTPKSGGSWVDQAGKLAFCSGALLWQNKTQQILGKVIDLAPTSPVLTITLGENEIDFKPIRGSERPCSIVRVAGVGYDVEDRIEEGSSINEERSAAASVPNLNGDGEVTNANDSNIILIRQTFEDWGWDNDYLVYTRTTDTYEARGIAVSDQFYYDLELSEEGSPFSLILADRTIERSIYGGNATPQEGFLVRQETELWQANGKAFADYYRGLYDRGGVTLPLSFTTLTKVSETIKKYDYIGTQTRRIEGVTYSRIAAVAGASPDWADTEVTIPDGLDYIISGRTYQAWEEVNPGEWRFIDRESQAGQTQGSIAVMLALSQIKNQITNSTSGQNDPPAAETKPPRYVQTEKELSGEARFEPVAGEDYAPRERTYQLDYLVSDAQCERLAEILGTFLHGRHSAIEVTVPFSNTWLSYEPLSRIDVDTGSITLSGLSSGVTWVLAANQAIVTCTLMKIGRVASGDETQIIKPYRIPRKITAGIGIGAQITIFNYGTSDALEITAGVGVGAPVITIESSAFVDTTSTLAATGAYSGLLSNGFADATSTLAATGAYSGSITQPTGGVSLYSHWKFENTSWTDEVGSRTLTGSGTVTSVSGFDGNALSVGTTSSHLYRDSITVAAGDWKVEFYLRFSSFVSGRGITAIDDNNTGAEFELLTTNSSGNRLILYIYGDTGATNQVTSSVTLSTNTWYLITMERSGSTLSLSVDTNTASTTITVSPYVSELTPRLFIGKSRFNSSLVALIDEYKLYKS